jgi:(p)ppGpp synthase/HD superfamily hydrolase
LLARFVHFSQKRSDGEDYINHPYRMVLKYIRSIPDNKYYMVRYNPNEDQEPIAILTKEQKDIVCAIWLHDTIEDADPQLYMNEFILTAFGYDVWNIVIRLTHDLKLESYNEYIAHVFQHDIAWKIKWLDMEDNTSYPRDPQRNKYQEACTMLALHGVEIPTIIKERLNIR